MQTTDKPESRGALLAGIFAPVFLIGCVVSLIASGRLSLRLIGDGMMSFAFVPVFEIATFAILWLPSRRDRSFRTDATAFLNGNFPWRVWLFLLAICAALVTPNENLLWTSRQRVFWGAGSLAPFLIWAAKADLRFYRTMLGRSPSRAMASVIVQRGIAWSAASIYFFAFAIPPHVVRVLS